MRLTFDQVEALVAVLRRWAASDYEGCIAAIGEHLETEAECELIGGLLSEFRPEDPSSHAATEEA